jgi:hypothetical protein
VETQLAYPFNRRTAKPFQTFSPGGRRIDDGLIEGLSRCLQLGEGEVPLDLLLELHKLTYSRTRSSDTGDLFTPSINARQEAGLGRTVTLVDL